MEPNDSRKRHFIESENNSIPPKKRKKNEEEFEKLKSEFNKEYSLFETISEKDLQNHIFMVTESYERLMNEDDKMKTSFFPFQKGKQFRWQEAHQSKLSKFKEIMDKTINKAEDEKTRCSRLIIDSINNQNDLYTRRVINKIKKSKDEISKFIKALEKIRDDIKKYIIKHEQDVESKIKKREKFKSVKRHTVRGDQYQRILQVLIRQRGLTHFPDTGMEVGIEVSGVGQLDDCVYTKSKNNQCRFFQMKHKTDMKKEPSLELKILFKEPEITEKKLVRSETLESLDDIGNQSWPSLQTKSGRPKRPVKKDLHLLHYFESFCQIKANTKFKDCEVEEVTFITNRKLKQEPNNKLNSLLLPKMFSMKEDKVLFFTDIKAEKFGLDENKVFEQFGETLFEISNMYFIQIERHIVEEIIRDFLRKVCIVVNYPDLEELRALTFNEIFNENVFHSLGKELLESWTIYFEVKLLELDNEFLTNESWREKIDKLNVLINNLKAIAITKLKSKIIPSQSTINVSFEAVKDMEEDLRNLLTKTENSVLNCVSKNLQMTFIKISHILENLSKESPVPHWLFCDSEDLFFADCFIEAFNSEDFKLLIVMCQTSDQEMPDQEKLIDELATKLGDALVDDSKKIILVSENDNWLSTNLQKFAKDKYYEKSYNHGFKDLTKKTKEEMLDSKIIFQRKSITLRQLVNEKLANIAIDENGLWEIIQKRRTVFNLNSNEESFCSQGFDEKYYIPRQFYQKIVSFETLKSLLERYLIFISGVHGMEINTILKRLEDEHISREFIDTWGSGIGKNGIILVDTNEFKYTEIVNEIPQENSNYFWFVMNKRYQIILHSKKNTNENVLITHRQQLIDEDKLKTIKSLGETVILVGDSGVGKSTTLTSLANRIRQDKPSTWIAKINLRKQFVHKVLESLTKGESEADVIPNVIQMIYMSNFHNYLEKSILLEGLKNSYKGAFKFALLLDGYNEIDKNSQENVNHLLQSLRKYCNISQILVTTQEHKKFELENCLQVKAYTLKPLDDQAQGKLMAQYWKYSRNSPFVECSIEDLTSDAEKALKDWKESIGDKDKNKQFTENPLHLIMLADVLLFSKSKMILDMNLLTLYDKFVQNKFSVYKRESSPSKNHEEINVIATAKDKLFESIVRQVLQEKAVLYILKMYKISYIKEETLPKMKVYQKFIEDIGKDESDLSLTKVGLLTQSGDNELDFIHFSFAHYFLCEYIVRNLSELNLHFQRFFIENVWCEDSLKPCRNFLNKALAKFQNLSDEQFEQEMKSNKEFPKNFLTQGAKKSLLQKKRNSSIPILEQQRFLVLFLLRWLSEGDYKDYLNKVLRNDLEYYSAKIDEIIQLLYNSSKMQSTNALIRIVGCKYEHSGVLDQVLSDLKMETTPMTHDSGFINENPQNSSRCSTDTDLSFIGYLSKEDTTYPPSLSDDE